MPVLPLVFLPIVAAVFLSSRGPIFYGHERIREDGKSFKMWKFRTMYTNSTATLERHLAADSTAKREWELTHKLKNDPRITRVGAWLRSTSLDELPQIWNVFIGSMSLVGPRPITTVEIAKYGDYFADYCRVKPGITGLWQVSGRSELSYEQRVLLDFRYVAHWSLKRDLAILYRTVGTIFKRHGAY